MSWDVFISYASEDRQAVAEPLARRLKARGLRVWYDRFELSVGDSIRRKIDEGLRRSRFGIVVLSRSFFSKNFPQRELDALFHREDGEKIILPIWYELDQRELQRYSAMLADRFALRWANDETDEVVDRILSEIRTPDVEDDAPLFGRSRYSPRRLAILGARLKSHQDDLPGDSQEKLVNDRSVPAVEVMFEDAVEDATTGRRSGYGFAGVFCLGDAALPWIARLLTHADDRVVRGAFSYLSGEGSMGDDDSHRRVERIVAGLVDSGKWKDAEVRLRQVVSDTDEQLLELLALGQAIAGAGRE